MMDIQKKVRYGKAIIFMLLLLSGIFGGFTGNNNVQAATTCKSLVACPGKTVAKVNMRKKAGTTFASYGMIKKNKQVTILGYTKNQGITWYKCKAKVNGKTRVGYVSSSYVVKSIPALGVVNNKVSSTLPVRKTAKITGKVLTTLQKGAQVTVLSMSKKSSRYWYKVKVVVNNKTITGYVVGKYITVGDTVDTGESQTGYVNDQITTYLNVREYASTSSTILMQIPRNTTVSIIGNSGDWYKVKVTYNGKTVTGYVSKTYITIGTQSPDDSQNNNQNNNQTDNSFETLIKNFPDSYQTALRSLHEAYPNWKFVAINTNLDWATVIKNESVVGRNVIQSNYPNGLNTLAPFSYLSTVAGAYNWATDTYTVKDGTNWYCASEEVVAYYMDPRNFLNSTDIFQFEALAFEETQNISVVQSILSDTFMKGNYSVTEAGKIVKGSYKQAFMDAGKAAEANPYFLAARSRQEVGVNGSEATSGNCSGYEGIYNFYNIGAYDGTNAVVNGLKWASGGNTNATSYGRPWTTPYKSIVGGAQYIAKNYINVGQNTLYFQKFNVNPKDSEYLYVHQYMTNVQAPYAEGRTAQKAYSNMGVLNDIMIFYIPVYNNMPAEKCSLPKSAGNPNPYLSGIKVYNGSDTKTELSGLTPTFQYNTYTYTMVVPKSVSSVAIKATTVSSRASVSGTGTKYLNDPGELTTIKIVGKAENGTQQTYTVHIIRQEE